jgi:GPH family glycoside/pentoside/hexuronide:cation symporter
MSNKNSNILSIKEKVGYGLGDAASHFVWDMVGFWMLFFYTETFGISAIVAGTIMGAARFWDMLTDPIMGVIADRTNTRWGKFRPYLLWISVPYSVLAVLAFSTPDLGPTGKVVYATATYFLLMAAYTAINLPYSSLGAVMTSDSYERASLNSYRFFFGFGGMLIVTSFTLTISKFLGKGDEAKGYQLTLVLFAALSLIFFLITFFTTKERIQPPKQQKNSIKEDFKLLFSNKPWIILSVVGIISFVMFAMQNASIAYYFKFNIGDTEEVQLFNFLSSVALLSTLFLSKPLSNRFGKKNVFMASSIISGIFFALIYIPGPDQKGLLYTFNILAKMAYAPAVPLLWTMIADTADYSEWKSNRRATGLFFSAATFAQKAGWGIGVAATGWILGWFGFIEQSDFQPSETAHGIKLLISIIPGILYVSCALFLHFYTIDSDTCDTMKKDLDARRLKEGQE